MINVFLAYASGNNFHDTVLRESATQASTMWRKITPWSDKDTSGQSIARSVESWIEDADAFVADISVVNYNVTYEIGYAIGQGKSVRLIRSTHADYTKVRQVGLLDTLGHDTYDFQPKLKVILQKDDTPSSWRVTAKNRNQPIFVLQPPQPIDVSRTVISAIKKIARYKFHGFNPAEISRLNASEAFEQTAASFGVILFWIEGDDLTTIKNNQRAAFIFGVARGLEMPAYLIAHESSTLPLDLHDSAARWRRMDDLDGLIASFRDEIADQIVQYADTTTVRSVGSLANLSFGDPVAENEQSELSQIFLDTDAFSQALSGHAHVLVGRKGSGKSAAFFQVRDRLRSSKANIIVDLMPEGYQLIKLKEVMLDKLSLGNRKEVIAAFWEYILWLEIAYKLLEKDATRARYDPATLLRYDKLKAMFNQRVDTGEGDFSERLRLLSDNVIRRFEEKVGVTGSAEAMKSSDIIQIIYGEDLRQLRDLVLDYLRVKGFVQFLFDNLDRIWTPGGFTASDATIIIGLVEAMQEIERKFLRKSYDFRWTLFIRSDVYEFLIAGMADYGKLSVSSLEWSDRGQMESLFSLRMRVLTSRGEDLVSLSEVSEGIVAGRPVMDYLIDGSMMRPRYLIRMFETARRRALALKRSIIIADDYTFALNELGWQALEDLDREITDLVPNATNFLFEILENADALTPDKIRYLAAKQLNDPADIEKLINVMIWNGSLGVETQQGPRYIFNSGYKRQYIASIVQSNKNHPMLIHPTLRASLASA